jgi:hypothetical protein
MATASSTRAPDDVDELVDAVIAVAGVPVDAWAVAATLESRGMRDVDAVARYGRDDVFALAREVYERALERAAVAPPPAAPPLGRRRAALRLARQMGKGAFFFVPLAVQVVALLTLGYSQWASVDFSLSQASIVGLAAGLSFVVTGGFVQGLGYLGPFFGEPGKHRLAEQVTWWTMLAGMAGALAFGGLLYGANVLTGAYPSGLAGVGLVYYALMASLWLVDAMLYMLHRYLAMLVTTLAGLGVVAAARSGADLSMYHSHWLGLGASTLLALAWGAVILRHRARSTTGDLRLARLPRRSVLARVATPFFVYGGLYFALLFCDRLAAWSAGDNPLPLWFRVSYELGLDGALVAIVGSLAFLQHTVEDFTERVPLLQERVAARARADHNRRLLRFYARQLAIVLVLALVGAVVVFALVQGLADAHALGRVRKDIEGDVTPSVFAIGAGAYALLAWGLLNTTLLMGLARPWPVVRALVLALAVDAAVGFPLSRVGPYWLAVVGLAAGCATFAAVTAVSAVRSLRRGDYHYFAAW